MVQISELFEFLRPLRLRVPLIRIGGTGDGAYLVPDVLHEVAACFSPGCCNNKKFEDELLERFGISSYLCDYSSDFERFSTSFVEGKQFFLKKWLSGERRVDCVSLEDWVTDSGVLGDLLLQMDIEGAEFDNLRTTPVAILKRFSVMVIEFHWSEKSFIAGQVSDSVREAFEKIMPLFRCVHIHPNNCCGEFSISGVNRGVPRVFECTFVRNDLFDEVGVIPVEFAVVPHRDDISLNVQTRRPLILGKGWGADITDCSFVRRGLEFAFDYTEARSSALEAQIQELQSRVIWAERRLGEIGFVIRCYVRLKETARYILRFFG